MEHSSAKALCDEDQRLCLVGRKLFDGSWMEQKELQVCDVTEIYILSSGHRVGICIHN